MLAWQLTNRKLSELAELKRHKEAIEIKPRFTFRGNNALLQTYINEPRPREVLIEGPAETGKTYAALQLLDSLARKYSRATGAIVRKVRADMGSTVLNIFKREFIVPLGDIDPYGGENPEFYRWPNGTHVYTAGMDRPGKVLSGALDFVYVNQAEELEVEDWETLFTRTTGRAGVIIPGILFGDMNPTIPLSWIYQREKAGRLLVLSTSHKDNPSLFDDQGNPTERGTETLERLSSLTGVRKERLFYGRRVMAEGLIYSEAWSDGPEDGNVTAKAEYDPNGGAIYWACDDGYSAGSAAATRGIDPDTHEYVSDAHPRVFLIVQMRSDGGLNVIAESYACLKRTDDHIREVMGLPYPSPDFAAYGPGAAEFRGALIQAGLATQQCTEKIDTTIAELRNEIAVDRNGWRRIWVHPRCKHLRAEMSSYSYEPGSTEKPAKQFDHGPDALRYLVWKLRRQKPRGD